MRYIDYYTFSREGAHTGWRQDDTIWSKKCDAIAAIEALSVETPFVQRAIAYSIDGGLLIMPERINEVPESEEEQIARAKAQVGSAAQLLREGRF